ncbi:hypothetical protein M6B38_153220 [Iris pallida]|nr:hypothetical protein M6B38_153220 [Iris pallida]
MFLKLYFILVGLVHPLYFCLIYFIISPFTVVLLACILCTLLRPSEDLVFSPDLDDYSEVYGSGFELGAGLAVDDEIDPTE